MLVTKMKMMWRTIWLFVLVISSAGVLAQKPPPTPPPTPRPPPTTKTNSTFIVPDQLSDVADKFEKGDHEYLFVDIASTHLAAQRECKHHYQARLAVIPSVEIANFLAEALSETRLNLDSLWVSAKRIPNTTNDWVWLPEESQVSEEIKNLFIDSPVKVDNRDCLAFGRSDHDVPQFRSLACNAERSIICQRPKGGEIDEGSTHPGWIKIGIRYYKIFSKNVNYTDAEFECGKVDINAHLAVSLSFKKVQLLGRYLLVGRPSLENAWIGGEWSANSSSYIFEEEAVVLANQTDADGFPPWRNKTIQKVGGCLLLDRHTSNITYFVEARCSRLRPYICYKRGDNDSADHSSTDVIIPPFGYRLHYNKLSWDNARDYCKTKYQKYNATLSEISNADEVQNLLYVMGENKTAVQHIWLGAKLIDANWVWDTKNVTVDAGYLNLITNITYTQDVEGLNVCLNMDRENHATALHYGTNCRYPQYYVCTFTKDQLEALEIAERTYQVDPTTKTP